MTRRASQRARMRVDQLLPVHARMHEERLADDFTQRTIAAVRLASARRTQQRALAPACDRRAALALAGLLVACALVASLTFDRGAAEPRPAPDQVARAEVAPPHEPIAWPTLELSAPRTISLDSPFVAPIRDEAEALIDTGRDVGFAMLSALPARPRAWTERLEAHPGR